MAELLKIIILSLSLGVVCCKPSCKFGDSTTDLVCSSEPEDEGYILEKGLVSDNNRTKNIIMKDCRITDVEPGSFSDLYGLRQLDLSNNKLETLKIGAFEGAGLLTHLFLANNALGDLPVGVFDSVPRLELLNLKGNKMYKVEEGLFHQLRRLGHLDLSSNFILGGDFSPNLFKNNNQMGFIDFSGNNMNGIPDNIFSSFQNIDFINLAGCSQIEVPTFATAANLITMKRIMLISNKIANITNPDTFKNVPNLEMIYLSDNVIECIDGNVFSVLPKLRSVTLNNNRLRTVSDNLFTGLKNLHTVDLSNNLLEYVPTEAFKGTSLNELNLSGNRFSYLPDNFCKTLQNSGTSLKKFFFSKNPWQCSCLYELIKEVKSLELTYDADDYGGTLPVCFIANPKDRKCKKHEDINKVYIDMYIKIITQSKK